MWRFLLRRLLQSLLAITGVLVAVFFLVRLTGDPVSLLLPVGTPIEIKQQYAQQYGFNDPVIEQFGRYVRGVLSLDFGTSVRQQRSAMTAVFEALPVTLSLAALAMSISFVLALIVGSIAAARAGGVFDRIASGVSLAGASVPDFWIAIVAILFFAVQLKVLPTSGTGGFDHWLLPVAVLLLRPFGLLVQIVRGAMISALASPYIKTARAKGASYASILFVHALRNSLLPVITVASDLAAGLLNGAIVVEVVFGFPGVGRLLLDGIVQRDFAIVQSVVLVTSLCIMIMNLLIDLLYVVIDPRIRHS